MSFRVMPKTALPAWLDRLRAEFRVVGPKASHGQYVFGDIREARELRLDYPTSVLPPKKYLLPQRENLLCYQTDGTRLEVCTDAGPTVVLGVHTCDLHALQLLDRVFANGFADQHYLSRRSMVILVSVECLTPCMPATRWP